MRFGDKTKHDNKRDRFQLRNIGLPGTASVTALVPRRRSAFVHPNPLATKRWTAVIRHGALLLCLVMYDCLCCAVPKKEFELKELIHQHKLPPPKTYDWTGKEVGCRHTASVAVSGGVLQSRHIVL